MTFAILGAAVAVLVGDAVASATAGLVGLLLAVVAPIVILRRIVVSPTITVRLVLGALAIYLLLGLAYAYLFPFVATLTKEPFFVQTARPNASDYIYFSYTTLATIGFGDFTAGDEPRPDDRRVRGPRRAAVPRLRGRAAGRQRRSPLRRNEPNE